MTTDLEGELRELLHGKAGEAPVARPGVAAAAPQEVLRRGRLHQIGTVVGSILVVSAVVVGSVAGMSSLLRGNETVGGGEYEVFERTATIEAFTVTSPSDWYLVNQWPRSMALALGSGSASETCTVGPSGNQACTSDPEVVDPIHPPQHGFPVFQLSNVDLGLGTDACGSALPPGAAVLSVVYTGQHIIDSNPYGEWPGTVPDTLRDAPCGEGRYQYFTVSGYVFFAWTGFTNLVTASDDDRATVMGALNSTEVADTWEPAEPDHVSPAYVLVGGTSDDGEPWRLELRPSESNVELTLMGAVPLGAMPGVSVPAEPIDWCCGDQPADPIFGAVSRDATGVEFWPGNGSAPVPGTILPVPPSLGSFDFDLFFIERPEGHAAVGGEVIALGIDTAPISPPPVAEPRATTVELTGEFEGQRWSVSFTGAFTGPGSPCWEITVEGPPGHVCPDPVHSTLAGPSPYLVGSHRPQLYLLAGSVPPEVTEIRFDGDDDAIVPQQFRCEMGPLGWTDPDRKVCAIALPSSGSGTLRYLDADGDLRFEEGMSWGQAEPELCCPVQPEQGGTYWGVYAWYGSSTDEAAIEATQRYLEERGVHGLRGSLSCDEGAAETLGTSAEHKVAVYFETEEEADTFALDAGLLGHEADPVVAKVTITCLE